MQVFESLETLSGTIRDSVINLLYRMADDELIMGYAGLEWLTQSPIEQQTQDAFASIAGDEVKHAGLYYRLLHELGEAESESLILSRGARQFRCSSLVSLPDGQDWTLGLLRLFMYQTAETIRLAALAESSLQPLAELAGKLLVEERPHLKQARDSVLKFISSSADGSTREQAQLALIGIYPRALGLFEPTEADEPLAQSGICPREEELCHQWESAVAPVLAEADLDVPQNAHPAYGGRVGRHPESFAERLASIKSKRTSRPTPKN